MTLLIAVVVGPYCYFASLTHKLEMAPATIDRINKTAGPVLTAVEVYVAIK